MFGHRSDGTAIRDLAPMRRMMPHVSPRRNESLFYLMQEIGVDAALEFCEKRNRERPPDRPITLFHLFLRSFSQMLTIRPGLNRFVKGGRIYERDGVYLTFSAKRELVDGAPLLTIKRRFDPANESLEAMVDAIYDKLQPARAGRESTSDKETRWLLRLPNVVTYWAVRAADGLDALGLLPRAMIEADPLYTSIFVANLGSVGLDAGFHHLWERGTASLFTVLGAIREKPDGRQVVSLAWTYDERVEDGLYASLALAGNQERIENPELLCLGTAELLEREGGRSPRP